MRTVRLTAGQAIVRFLAAQESERDGQRQRFIAGVWGIFGHGNVAGLGEALEELGDACGVRFYRSQNEQAQVHIATAFARHHDRLRAFACTSSVGPGATNMITGAATATVNRIPVLLLPSDVFANRFPDPVLQQVQHPTDRDVSVNDAFRPVSRYFDRITRPEQLLGSLPAAFRVLTDPAETGAVTLSLPEDVQAEAWDWPEAFFEPRVWHIRRQPPEASAIAEAVGVLGAARRPLIVAGGGVRYSGAGEALSSFATAHGIPIAESQAGKGTLPWDHPMVVGPVGTNGSLAANRLARDADVVVAIGTRLGDFVTASHTAFQDPGVRFVTINAAASDAAVLRGTPVVADAREALRALEAAWPATGDRDAVAARRTRVADLKAEWDDIVTRLRTEDDAPGDPAQSNIIGTVNDAVGGDATVICAAGSLPGDLLRLWRSSDPHAYHVEYGFSCMGYEIAAGLGVSLAEPDRHVVVMVGDGSYLMLNSEIVTAVAEGLKLTIVVIDNHGFQCILALQRSAGIPDFANELRFRDGAGHLAGPYVPVDFRAHAAAMGASATFATTLDELRSALDTARLAPGVSVIVIPAEPEKRMPSFEAWWDVPIPSVAGREPVEAARRAYDQARIRQRLELH